jgi:hypothetical protein
MEYGIPYAMHPKWFSHRDMTETWLPDTREFLGPLILQDYSIFPL